MKVIVGVKTENHKIVPIFSGEENPGHAVFTTVADNQEKAIFNFYYMNNKKNDWQFVGSIILNNIPPAPAGDPVFDLHITVNDSGEIVSRVGDPVSGVYKSFQICSKRLVEDENYPVSHSVPCAEKRGILFTGNLKNKKKSSWLKIILTILIIITGVFIASKLKLLPELKVPIIVKTHFEKSIPKMYIPLNELIKTGQKKDIGKESKEKKNISFSMDEEQFNKTDKTDLKRTHVVSQSIKNTINTEPVHYRIIWGDTLWSIAKRFYGEPRLFPLIAQKNNIPNPDLIIKGDTLQIPFHTGNSVRIDKEEKKPK